MNLDKIPEEKLFSSHPREVVSRWCRNLHYFHYMRARAGHNCEGDSFAAHFNYSDRDDLLLRMSQLGVSLNVLSKDVIVFDPFASYNIDNLDKIRYAIPGCNDLEQPQDVTILGCRVHIWVQKDRFEISVSGMDDNNNAYTVSEKDFDVCTILERKFDELSWMDLLDDEIKQHPHCISKEKYPELF